MKNYKRIFALALCLIVAALCAACSAPATAGKDTFVVGLDDSFPPMGFRDDDSNLVGFDVDLATEVAKRLGMSMPVLEAFLGVAGAINDRDYIGGGRTLENLGFPASLTLDEIYKLV